MFADSGVEKKVVVQSWGLCAKEGFIGRQRMRLGLWKREKRRRGSQEGRELRRKKETQVAGG